MYRTLNLPVPLIAYTILHRPRAGVGEEAYRSILAEMHRRVAAEAAAVRELVVRAAEDDAAREVQRLRGGLLHFLETPMRRDKEDVARTLLESLGRARDTASPPVGVAGSRDGRFAAPKTGSGATAAHVRRGREYLTGLGFEGSAAVWESQFFVEGGANLDLLEHIVRDRMGVYASTHGRHIGQFTGFASSVHNLVGSRRWSPGKPTPAPCWEVAVHFAKPGVRYDEFRAALERFLDVLAGLPGAAALSLWQRKLGLGRGEEYVLRCEARSEREAVDIAARVAAERSDPLLGDAVARHGRALLREIHV